MTSARDSDPLLRAVAGGDPHCPDGQALARLGALVRGEQPLPGDLRERVAHLLATDEADVASDHDEGERVDRHFDRELPDAELARLGELTRLLRPAPADLRERVRKQLAARPAAATPEAPVSSRAQAVRTAHRGRGLRIILGVAAVHAAALLLVALMVNASHQREADDSGTLITAKPAPRLPEVLPADWSQLQHGGFDLMALRRSPELRAAARRRFGMERSANAVACGLRWLIAQQGADGTFGAPVTGVASAVTAGDSDAAATRQALVLLALLAEGGGPTTIDRERQTAVTRGLAALPQATGTHALSLVALARVEAALLGLGERQAAEAALAAIMPAPPADQVLDQPFPSTELDPVAVLAGESARQAGYAVPPTLLDRARAPLSGPLTADNQDPGRTGLAAFTRLVLGYRENPSTTLLLEILVSRPPAADPAGVDAAGWLYASLALREAGGAPWDAWVAPLQARLVPLFVDAGPGQARVPATALRAGTVTAGDDLAATAQALLDLQVAYRYLPTR